MNNNPFITYIAPIRNESLFIERMIKSIINQNNNNFDFEIIVADGMSTDGTRNIINRLMKTVNEIKLIDNPEKIVSTGFNRALSISKGDYIIRIDGHAELATDFLQNSLRELKITNADCVGGPIINIATGIIGNAIAIAQQSKFGVGGVAFRENNNIGKYVDTLAFGTYKRNVFKKIGGYDIELLRNQDDEFNFRMLQQDLKIWLHPSIKSYYYPKNSIHRLFMQYFQYGFFKIRVFQKRSAAASFRHIIPLIFIINLFFAIYSLLVTDFYMPIIILGVFYTSISIVFSIREALKNFDNGFSLIFLPICFLTLHIAYGLGSFIGLFYFINKWNDKGLKDKYFDKKNF